MAVQSQERPRWMNTMRMDYFLLGIVLILVCIGLIMVASITLPPRIGNLPDPQSEFVKQLGFAALGLVLLIVLSRTDYHIWQRLAVPIMLASVAGLILVLFMPAQYGAHRWLFDTSIQPAEFAKLTMIIYMATWLSSKGEKLRDITYGLLPFGVLVGGVAGLILLEPSISTAVIISMCAGVMFYIAGIEKRQFIGLGVIGSASMLFVVFRMEHAVERIFTFLKDPFASKGPEVYQITETLIALGSGMLLGRGLGSGYAKFGFVPTPYTDSIFALLGEELGLAGTWLVLGLFLCLAYRGFRIASRATDSFGQVLATGLTFWIIFQALVNIAVVTATAPYTGVPLPFISYGGSSLLMALAAMGVLLSISRNESLKEANATFDFRWGDGRPRVSRVERRRRDTADD